MDPNGSDPIDEYPPSWFSNEDEPEIEDHRSSTTQYIIVAGVVLVVSVLLLIPVLQAEILQRQRESLPDAEAERTALLFTSAMLFGRSEGQALLFTDESDGPRGEVRSTLQTIVSRPQPSRQARLLVNQIPCRDRDADSCYVGRVISSSSGFLSGIRFGIRETSDGYRVIWVELDEQIAGHPAKRA